MNETTLASRELAVLTMKASRRCRHTSQEQGGEAHVHSYPHPGPTALRSRGQRQIEVTAPDFGLLLEQMEATYPGITKRLRDEDGALRRTLNIHVNGENIRFLRGLATPLRHGDEVSIVPAIAGGKHRAADLTMRHDGHVWGN